MSSADETFYDAAAKADKKQVTLSTDAAEDASTPRPAKSRWDTLRSRLSRLQLDSVTQYSDLSGGLSLTVSAPPASPRRFPPEALRQRSLSRRALCITSRLSGFAPQVGLAWRQQRADLLSSSGSIGGRPQEFENTYQLSPDPSKSFDRPRVQRLIADALAEILPDSLIYSNETSAKICLCVSEVVRARLKGLAVTAMPRYKWVCQALMGENKGQAVRVASRCLWDATTDNFQSVRFENGDLCVVVIVHGVYWE